MKKKIFLTGIAGFIGSHLAKSLAKRGDHVLGYDNFNDYYSPNLKRARAEELKALSVEIIEGDINDRTAFESAVKQHGATHLVHLAAQAGVRYSVTNPDVYMQTNLLGFFNVLEICRNHSLPLVFASSSSVYGLNEKIPFEVQDRTDRPASLYGATKKANELLAHSYHHLYKIPVTGLRFFTVYGPWGRPDMAYYHFTEAILNGKTIDIYNEGKMKRDFTYIDDIILGIQSAIDTVESYNIFNLGNNKPIELMEFITCIEEALGRKAKKNFLPMQMGDVEMTYADILESEKKLGFKPSTSIQEGIPKFIDWYKRFANNN